MKLNDICSYVAEKLLPPGTEVELVDHISKILPKKMKTKILSWKDGRALPNRRFVSIKNNVGDVTEGWFHTRIKKVQ